jgi:hypothetical protein
MKPMTSFSRKCRIFRWQLTGGIISLWLQRLSLYLGRQSVGTLSRGCRCLIVDSNVEKDEQMQQEVMNNMDLYKL